MSKTKKLSITNVKFNVTQMLKKLSKNNYLSSHVRRLFFQDNSDLAVLGGTVIHLGRVQGYGLSINDDVV